MVAGPPHPARTRSARLIWLDSGPAQGEANRCCLCDASNRGVAICSALRSTSASSPRSLSSAALNAGSSWARSRRSLIARSVESITQVCITVCKRSSVVPSAVLAAEGRLPTLGVIVLVAFFIDPLPLGGCPPEAFVQGLLVESRAGRREVGAPARHVAPDAFLHDRRSEVRILGRATEPSRSSGMSSVSLSAVAAWIALTSPIVELAQRRVGLGWRQWSCDRQSATAGSVLTSCVRDPVVHRRGGPPRPCLPDPLGSNPRPFGSRRPLAS